MAKYTKEISIMRTIQWLLFSIVFIICTSVAGDSTSQVDNSKDVGYRIEQPGTITFTVGIKIMGKVKKPQVVIFLPKEKPTYREMEFSYSFKKDLSKPLPFIPIIE